MLMLWENEVARDISESVLALLYACSKWVGVVSPQGQPLKDAGAHTLPRGQSMSRLAACRCCLTHVAERAMLDCGAEGQVPQVVEMLLLQALLGTSTTLLQAQEPDHHIATQNDLLLLFALEDDLHLFQKFVPHPEELLAWLVTETNAS